MTTNNTLITEHVLSDSVEIIFSIEKKLLSDSKKMLDMQMELDNEILLLKEKIAYMTDNDGKLLYSNDIKRQAALNDMKLKDDNIITMENNIKELKYTIDAIKIQLKYENNLLDVNKLIYSKNV